MHRIMLQLYFNLVVEAITSDAQNNTNNGGGSQVLQAA